MKNQNLRLKKVWFIRHGESESNIGLQTSDSALINLTPKGFEQSNSLVDIIDIEPDLFVVTKFIRTQLTAEPTIKKFPSVPVKMLDLHEFDFLSVKLCINTTPLERRPMVTKYWDECNPDLSHGGDAESFRVFFNRVLAELKKIEEMKENFIVVFAHGHIMRAIWQLFYTNNKVVDSNSMKYFRDVMTLLKVPNCGIFKSNFKDGVWSIDTPNMDDKDFFYDRRLI